jgi:hypothetical protein
MICPPDGLVRSAVDAESDCVWGSTTSVSVRAQDNALFANGERLADINIWLLILK